MTETASAVFAAARARLVDAYDDPESIGEFEFPDIDHFVWARDWFDWYAAGRSTAAVCGPSAVDRVWLEVSYDELARASSAVAAALIADCLRPGDRVLIDMSASVELYAVLLGVLKVGAVVIPVHHGLHPDSLAERVAVARPHWVIADQPRPGSGAINGPRLVSWEYSGPGLPELALATDAPAFGCFTSGTTGRPKLALHSNRSHGIAHLASLYWNRLDTGQRHLNISSPGWAKFFWSSFLVPLTAGATVVIRPDSLAANRLETFIAEHEVESLCAPVVYLRDVLAGPRGNLANRLRDVTSVGEVVPTALRVDIMRTWGVQLREGFGQTEATAILGELKCRPDQWTVLPGYQVKLVEDEATPAPRLMFSALPKGSFLGYLQEGGNLRPPALEGGWQWTGDFATGVIEAGTLQLLGRGDDVFRSNGHLVAPAEVEGIIERHPAVDAAAVVPRWSSDLGIVPVAYVVAGEVDVNGIDEKALVDWVNERLPAEVDLSAVTVVERLPRSINGKIQRALLAGA
ncbi:AMP-binding protein [Dietzia maris]|uniref:AMP-binding protein n=1 Tax=Dietzia maris TaxID=37915 RepID=UPI0037CB9745